MHQSLFSIFLSLLLSSSPSSPIGRNYFQLSSILSRSSPVITSQPLSAAAVIVALPQSPSSLLYHHNLCLSRKSISLFLIAVIIPLTACIGIIILTEVAGFVNL
ncbi:hypothetical protein WN944_018649 [Citrus x changshan-huyou]|uniref:Uncharacterized protein n=1 Tax=Citrus x changshan-huyou TaxID=2935761 RepID=A0AAP0LWQ4_9ROSI